jgi:hypothetical protein
MEIAIKTQKIPKIAKPAFAPSERPVIGSLITASSYIRDQIVILLPQFALKHVTMKQHFW